MGLTTDIETTQKTNRLKVVVDMSQPVSVHPKNQTELDILVKMDLLDDDDTEKLLCFINELLAKDKYEGRRESAIEYLAEQGMCREPSTCPADPPPCQEPSLWASCGTLVFERYGQQMNNGGKSKRIADSTGGVLLCYSFLLNCLENGTIMWGENQTILKL